MHDDLKKDVGAAAGMVWLAKYAQIIVYSRGNGFEIKTAVDGNWIAIQIDTY